jgi:hypothetical protein
LREAKELAEARAKEEEAFAEERKSSFGAQFDDFQGLLKNSYVVSGWHEKTEQKQNLLRNLGHN